jgi:hypothetical protein
MREAELLCDRCAWFASIIDDSCKTTPLGPPEKGRQDRAGALRPAPRALLQIRLLRAPALLDALRAASGSACRGRRLALTDC